MLDSVRPRGRRGPAGALGWRPGRKELRRTEEGRLDGAGAGGAAGAGAMSSANANCRAGAAS
ncbi:hypothetical protein [Streptomyces sp. NPDC003077]|uniref:hypothetical protein n=1 Tax=Streptomyces sp. NPDC003077 TaxID=3154443 RepID=UPI0033A5B52E